MSEYLSAYKMVLTDSRHISGLLLDRACISKKLYEKNDVTSTVRNVPLRPMRLERLSRKDSVTNVKVIFEFTETLV